MATIAVVEDTTRSTLTIPSALGGKLDQLAVRTCIDKVALVDVLLLLMIGPLKRMLGRDVLAIRGNVAATEGPGFGARTCSVNCSKTLAHQLGRYAKTLRLSRNWLFYDLAELLLTQMDGLEGFDRNTVPSVIRTRLKDAEAEARERRDEIRLVHPDTPGEEEV